MPTVPVLPNAVLTSSNLKDSSGAMPPALLTDIDEVVSSSDGQWWDATALPFSVRLGFENPGPISGTQTVDVLLRKGVDDFVAAVSLYSNGALVRALGSATITSMTGQIASFTFDGAEVPNPADVEILIEGKLLGADTHLVFAGSSTIAQGSFHTRVPALCASGAVPTASNSGYSGSTLADFVNDTSGMRTDAVTKLLASSRGTRILALYQGSNDIVNGQAATLAANLASAIAQVRAAVPGVVIALMTTMSRAPIFEGGNLVAWRDFNELQRASADVVIDLAADGRIADPGFQGTGNANFSDTTHLTSAGNDIAAGIIHRALVLAGYLSGTLVAPDTVADAFAIPAKTGQAASSTVTSDAVAIAGIDASTAWVVTGGTVTGGTAIRSYTGGSIGTVTNGQSLTVALTSSGAASTTTSAKLTAGGKAATFSVTTAAQATDTTPDAFAFTDVSSAALSTVTESNTITVAGINAAAPISVTGGEYAKNGGAWTTASGTVVLGDTLKVRATSSGSASTTVNVVLTIGGVSDTFSVTTAAAGGGTTRTVRFWPTNYDGVAVPATWVSGSVSDQRAARSAFINVNESYTNVLDILGVATPFDIVTTAQTAGEGNNLGSTTGANTGVFPDAVLVSNTIVGTGNTSAISGSLTFEIRGLDAAKLYSLRLSGSRNGISSRITVFKVTDNAGQTSQELDVANNTAGSRLFSNLVPIAGSNKLIVTFEPKLGAGYAYLSGFELVESA